MCIRDSSKPENLEENQANRMKMKAIRDANKPKTREEVGLKNNVVKKPSPFERKFGAERNEKRMISQGVAKKPLPTTAEIRAKDKAAGGTGMSNIPSKEGNAVIDGKKLNPDFGKKVDIKKEFPDKVDPKPLTKKEKFDKKFIRDPKTKTLKRRGSPTAQRAENKEKAKLRAQAMAKARIKSGKTIQQVKDENKASMIANARQRNVDFKAKRRKPPGEMKSNFAGGVSGKGKATDDFSKDPRYQSTAGTSTDIKKPVKQMGRSAAKRRQMMNKEEFTPYDIVLEYLLSSKQAATIEEANYIMTEMDAKTIQSIVAE